MGTLKHLIISQIYHVSNFDIVCSEPEKCCSRKRLFIRFRAQYPMLRLSFRRFLVLLETLASKPDIMAITEIWKTEIDPLEEFKIDGYQPIVSNPHKEYKRREG